MALEPFYDAVQARYRALSPEQQARVRQRMTSMRMKRTRMLYLPLLDSLIQLETQAVNPPAPEPCRPCDNPPEWGKLRRDAIVDTCLMSHLPHP